jgi:hypothetical protein
MDWINFFIFVFLFYILCVLFGIKDSLNKIHSQTMLLSRPINATITLDKDFNVIKHEVKDGQNDLDCSK